jgi:uridine phosphorylase
LNAVEWRQSDLNDVSITSPEIFIRGKAESAGLPFAAYRVPKVVAMIYNRMELQKLVELTKASLVEWIYSSDLFPFYKGKVDKLEIGLIFPGWGASTIAARMEEFVTCGAEVIVASGALGAFQREMEVGDYVIPIEAIRGEGTSQYYLPKGKTVSADPELIEIFEKACKKVGVKSFKGAVWTTDGFYRETRFQVERLQKQGVLGVEMETSAVYTVARFKGIRTACLLRVSDKLADLKWQMHWYSPEYRKAALETSPKIMLEALKLLAEGFPLYEKDKRKQKIQTKNAHYGPRVPNEKIRTVRKR